MPGVGQMLNMAVKVVANSLYKTFRSSGQIDSLPIAAESPQDGYEQNGGGGDPERLYGILRRVCRERIPRSNPGNSAGSVPRMESTVILMI